MDFEQVLADFVDSVVGRLSEQGVGGTPLHEEWVEVTSTDPEVRDFCIAAARLGLDPYSEVGASAELIERAGGQLRGALLEDFLNGADPAKLNESLTWLDSIARRIDRSTSNGSTVMRELRGKKLRLRESAQQAPWERGWAYARRVRKLLDIEATAPLDLSGFLYSKTDQSPDRGLQAAGGWSSNDHPILFLGRPMGIRVRRFAEARAICRYLQDDAHFVLTAAHADRQKVERAFAAELLAPAKAIASSLEVNPEATTQEDLDRVAEQFNVSPWVVAHQVENQLLGVSW